MPRSDLPAAVTEWRTRSPQLAMFRDYYDGKHSMSFASWKFRQQYRWMLQQSRENLMPACVKAFTDLKRVDSWTNEEAIKASGQQGIDRLAGLVHRDEFRAGDAFTITWRNPAGDVRAVFQRPEQMVPTVDDDNPDVLAHATRLWMDGDHVRANIYYPDRVERFITRLPLTSGQGQRLRDVPDVELGWREFDDDDQPAAIGHEFGAVPVCWWKRDADDQWSHGRSILAEVIPVQDELNYLVAVSNSAIERVARPIRFALVSSAEIVGAANGRVDFDPTREDVLTLTANSAGEFAPPSGSDLIALQAHAEQKIARVIGIPPYVFSQAQGEVPSGVSLRIVNERRTSIVKASNEEDTPVWRGQMQLLGIPDCEPLWADPVSLTEEEAAALAAVEKNDLGLPVELWLRTAGYDPGAVDENGVTLAERVASSSQQVAQTFLNGQAPSAY